MLHAECYGTGMDELTAAVTENGFAVIPGVLSPLRVEEVIDAVEVASVATAGKGGTRNLLDRVPGIRDLAEVDPIRGLVERVLGRNPFAARAILFDKTPTTNWKVPWHQDLTISVEARLDVAGFGPWTVKEGVVHVQPPTAILESMLAVRIHLDDCGEDNGPVRVIPGSHRRGRLTMEQIQAAQSESPIVTCPVGSGGVLLMRPLLLHASSAAVSPAHRRVIHIEFSSTELPGGLLYAGVCRRRNSQ